MLESPRVTVITPTYNEKESIAELIRRIHDLHIENLDIVVVDDNSPDGTGSLAERLGQQYPIRVIHRAKKEGLGKAYIHAFKEVLALGPETKPDYIIQMDADLSHDPASIPRFLEKIESCDVVLGSRYTRGGGIENWSLIRRMVSRFGNIYASLVLGIPYRDLTSGFKCFRREVLEAIDFTNISSVGYNFQIETTYYAHRNKLKICEIPIIFTERKQGTSKFNVGIIVESFWKVLLLRFRK
ncbi:MAG: hypothetical protein G01um101429_285 [Parcubacteria group bacterium Gr01-1014_29]|nr:MAG: hypothetical protein G01um101429_285 [Parcubacteria group bacterium Gr01-1014_29]